MYPWHWDSQLTILFIQDQRRSTEQMKQKIIGPGKYFKLLLFKIIWEDSHSKTSCLQEVVWPVVAVSFLYPDGFWPHHLVSGLMLPRTGHRLSKRPSNNSLIHFYKRCVSMALSLSIDHPIYSGSKKIHWTNEKCFKKMAIAVCSELLQSPQRKESMYLLPVTHSSTNLQMPWS